MTCPHQQIVEHGLRCGLLPGKLLAGPGNPNFPCHSCQSRWIDGQPPTSIAGNPILEKIAAPTLTQKAASLAGALWRWAGSGFSITTQEVYERRLAICQSCEHYRGKTCNLCGCALAGKLRMPTERCPAKPPKWEALERG